MQECKVEKPNNIPETQPRSTCFRKCISRLVVFGSLPAAAKEAGNPPRTAHAELLFLVRIALRKPDSGARSFPGSLVPVCRFRSLSLSPDPIEAPLQAL